MRLEVANLEPKSLDLVIDGETTELTIDVLTVEDSVKAGRLQTEIMNLEDINEDERTALILVARAACAVKNLDGSYYFEVNNLDELRAVKKGQAGGFWVAIANAVSIVNPLPLGEGDLEDRKK